MKIKKTLARFLDLPQDEIERNNLLAYMEQRNALIIKVRNISFRHSATTFSTSLQFREVIVIQGCTINGMIKKIYFLYKMIPLAERKIKVCCPKF